VVVTPWPSHTPSPTPSPLPTQTPTPVPTASATPVPTSGDIVINEIAWAGTAANAADEWIELYNNGANTVDLSGWSLCKGVNKIFGLQGSISASGYFLIERTDDTTISDIPADLSITFGNGGLLNSGEHLVLRNAGACDQGEVIDEVGPGAWYAGEAEARATMERIDPSLNGNDAANWATNSGTVTTGQDALGGPIRGTPKFVNSVSGDL
jgi:hypothetical protein